MRRLNWTLVWLFVVGVAFVQAAELRDVSWKCKGTGDCSVVYLFNAASGLPSYFQKYDSDRQVLKVAFSNTSISVEPNTWPIQAAATGLKSLTIKNETSAKGTPLLVLEWAVGRDVHADNNPVTLENDGRFVMKLATHSPLISWDLLDANKKLAKSKPVVKPAEKAVSKPIVAPMVTGPIKAAKAAPVKPELKAKTPLVQPVSPVVVQAPVAAELAMKDASLPQSLVALSWLRGYGVEQFVIQFQGEAPKNIHLSDSSLVIPLPKASHPSATVQLTSSSLIKEMRMAKASLSGYDLILKFKSGAMQVLTRGPRIWVQANVATSPGLETWSIGSTGVTHHLYDGGSGEDELQSLDQFAQGISKQPISTSQTFLLRKGARDLIVVEENAVLRDAPNEVGKQLQVLKFGDHLQSIELENLYYKVKINDVTGYVNRRLVSYPDELSHLQSEKLQQLATVQKKQREAFDSAGVSADSMLNFDNPGEDRITYSSFGRRDPFIELKGVVNAGINIDGVELVGIIWDAEIPMVLLTDSRNPGVSYTLKEGDNILNGKVLKITQDEVLFLINEFGVSRRYTMTLPDKYGGKK